VQFLCLTVYNISDGIVAH